MIRNAVRVSTVGVGVWAWGDAYWNYGNGYGEKDIEEAFLQLEPAGLTFIDTAEVRVKQSVVEDVWMVVVVDCSGGLTTQSTSAATDKQRPICRQLMCTIDILPACPARAGVR